MSSDADAAADRPRPWGRAAAYLGILVVPGLAFVALGEGFEAGVADRFASLSGWTLGLAVAGLLAADLLLPVPSSVVLALAATRIGLPAATLAGWVGLTVSCEIGYWCGRRLGRRFVHRRVSQSDRRPAADPLAASAAWWLVLSRPLPILAEAATLMAGLSRVPHGRFLVAVAVGNLWVSVCFAMLGVLGRDWPVGALLLVTALLPLAATAVIRRHAKSLDL